MNAKTTRIAVPVLLVIGWAGSAVLGQTRVPGEYVNEVRPDRFRTPCRAFAADYAKGPMKVLFLVTGYNGIGGREVVELRQRFPMEVAAIIYDGPAGDRRARLSTDDFWVAPIQGTFTQERLEVLQRLLQQRWDAFVFGNASMDALSPRTRYEILKQVSEGAGLLSIGNWLPKDFLAKPSLDSPHRILAGVPFPFLTSYAAFTKTPLERFPEELLKVYAFGRGRIAVLQHYTQCDGYWQGYHSLTPSVNYSFRESACYDYYLSIVAKALLWAVPGKASDILVEAPTTLPVNVDWPELPKATQWGLFRVPPGKQVECKAQLRDTFGAVIDLPSRVCSEGSHPLGTTLPRLPRGDYAVDFRFVSAQGTEGWASSAIVVRNAPVTIDSVTCAKTKFDRTEPFRAEIKLSRVPEGRLSLHARGFDSEGRQVFGEQVAAKSQTLSIEAPLRRCLVMPHHVRVELWDGNRCLDVAQQEFLVSRPDPAFPSIIWGGGMNTVVGRTIYSQLQRGGFNVVLGYDPLFEARNDMLLLQYTLALRFPAPSDKDPDCGFCNPDWVKKYVAPIQEGVKKNLPAGIYYYSLGDENSYSYTRERMAPSELKAFQQYVQEVYGGDVQLMNREWGSTYARFDEIPAPDVQKPMAAQDIPRKNLWMNFCEKLYADAHHAVADAIKEIDPRARVGAEGSLPGNLEWMLDGLEMWGPYPNRLDNALMRSFGRPDLLRGNWWGSYVEQRSAGAQPLWDQVLSGGVNSSYYFASAGMLSVDMSFADFFEEVQWPALREIAAGIGPLLNRSAVAKMGLGLYYSLPSEHALTVDTRFGTPGSSRDGLLKFCEESGISAFFYSERQIQAGKLDADSVRLLFLPQSLCMSDATAEALKKWVAGGGTLVADQQAALRNERGALRPRGALDELFGITQIGYPLRSRIPNR
jgi:hypothetical protein